LRLLRSLKKSQHLASGKTRSVIGMNEVWNLDFETLLSIDLFSEGVLSKCVGLTESGIEFTSLHRGLPVSWMIHKWGTVIGDWTSKSFHALRSERRANWNEDYGKQKTLCSMFHWCADNLVSIRKLFDFPLHWTGSW
jgi:hypothetical protein